MVKAKAKTQYAYCERVTATSFSPWHIRPLTGEGLKLGGGADTLALCGAKVAWDLQAPLVAPSMQYACVKCAELYRKAGAS